MIDLNASTLSRKMHKSFDSWRETLMLLNDLKARIRNAYADNEYPVGHFQAGLWSKNRPLAGLRVLDATPIFQNTISKYISLLEAGVELYVGLSHVMPKDDEVVCWLKKEGLPVVTPNDATDNLDLILDCAGAFSHLTPNIGFVELTRSGVHCYEDTNKPVFIADGGRIKRIETCLGTGESYFRAMAQLGYRNWQGKKIVIFGSGKVGTGLITYAHKYGCHITVVTQVNAVTDVVKRLANLVIAADDTEAICKAVLAADAVVTATGVAGALAKTCPAKVFMESKAIVANMGVEDEFGSELPAERVLEGKKPLNFILKDPTLMKYIDATMALHNAGALWLVNHPEAHGMIEPPAELENELLRICERDGTIAEELQYI